MQPAHFFLYAVLLVVAGLLVHGALTQGVWMRVRIGMRRFHLNEQPLLYCGGMGLYGFILVMLGGALVTGKIA